MKTDICGAIVPRVAKKLTLMKMISMPSLMMETTSIFFVARIAVKCSMRQNHIIKPQGNMLVEDLYDIIHAHNDQSEIVAMSIVVKDEKSGELVSYHLGNYGGMLTEKIEK